MRKLGRSIRLFLLGMFLVGVGSLSSAFGASLTLLDLQGGASFESLNSSLLFSGFSVTPGGSVTSPLSDFEVVVLADGFDVIGPWSAFSGESGTMSIEYTVTPAFPLVEAILSFNGSAAGAGAEAVVTEWVESVANLEVYARDGELNLLDSVAFSGTGLSLDVVEEIRVTSVPGGVAQISVVTRQFIVPEPGTAALLLLGAGGLLLIRRRS
jgi:hypothetical protein